jgi:hypothetical protein
VPTNMVNGVASRMLAASRHLGDVLQQPTVRRRAYQLGTTEDCVAVGSPRASLGARVHVDLRGRAGRGAVPPLPGKQSYPGKLSQPAGQPP